MSTELVRLATHGRHNRNSWLGNGFGERLTTSTCVALVLCDGRNLRLCLTRADVKTIMCKAMWHRTATLLPADSVSKLLVEPDAL